MKLDVRIPIGLMFGCFGLLLAGFGLVSGSNTAMYERSMGININLWWGIVLAVFAACMLILAARAAKRKK